jgi:Phosphomannomutase
MNDYDRWLKRVTDPRLREELVSLTPEEKEDAFYKNVEFGTGGLRGLLGVGPNRLNIYTVGRISQGIADFINRHYHNGSVAISFDSRINSLLFAQRAASIYAANGIRVHLYKELMPTPALSFAVRYLRASVGIMITASHNPKEYNGYKVYNEDGCQITLETANEISGFIGKNDAFDDVKSLPFDEALKQGLVTFIGDDCFEAYMAYILTKRVPKIKGRDLKIVYSPLNGTGLRCVTTALSRAGFSHVSVVPEQKDPDGTFRTCPKPNPELKEALRLGIALLEKEKGDLLLVTDPDCDRVGTALIHQGKIRLINGNEMGLLLYDFLLRHAKASPDSLIVKTIVTTDLIFPMAKAHGMKVVEVLTGFKFIGEQIGLLEKQGEKERFFFGFEESYGYLTGTEVRDKDAVDASLVIAQMFEEYKEKGRDPLDRLEEIYAKYGYVTTSLDNYEFSGEAGVKKMGLLMERFRDEAKKSLSSFAFVNDYWVGKEFSLGGEKKLDLPQSDVLKFSFPDGSTVTVRPSGTEPKLKIYFFVRSLKETDLAARLAELKERTAQVIKESGVLA